MDNWFGMIVPKYGQYSSKLCYFKLHHNLHVIVNRDMFFFSRNVFFFNSIHISWLSFGSKLFKILSIFYFCSLTVNFINIVYIYSFRFLTHVLLYQLYYPLEAFGNPECTIKFWNIGYVLWKAWWWFNRVETCCHKNVLCNKLLCLTEIYNLYEYNTDCRRGFTVMFPIINKIYTNLLSKTNLLHKI
jgi:hypothetical protein